MKYNIYIYIYILYPLFSVEINIQLIKYTWQHFISTAIQIILLSFEIDQLTKEMKASSSNDGMSL